MSFERVAIIGLGLLGGSIGRAPYTLQARLQQFQTLQDPAAPTVPPYFRLPQINFGANYNDFGGLVDIALPAEYVNFTHATLVEGARSTVAPTFAAPFQAPGWFVTPKLGLRQVSYALNRSAPGQPQAPCSCLCSFISSSKGSGIPCFFK